MELRYIIMNQNPKGSQRNGVSRCLQDQKSLRHKSQLEKSGPLYVDFLSRGKTINSEAYIETLQKLARIRRVKPNLEINKVLFQHDNA